MHFSFDDGYSALVAWLKTLLPIAALGLLSTIFLFSGKVDVTQSLPYAEHNVAEIIREQRITQPYFTGIASNGTEIALSAAYASPQFENADVLEITDLFVVLRSTSDRAVQVTAGQGALDSATQTAQISKNVHIAALPDFWVTTEALDMNLKQGVASAIGGFQGVTALGEITAGEMHLQMTADDQQIVFINDVRLVYSPKLID
ncbi:LPS export ABC transporter periplasmic protein LptC [Planktomarina temperata]|jgi:lipopolysaccharide export system protein LptC|uniref:LPS export ABC transporter periplasmic protein LptC n=1 Tax=Planktomarina temperata TaxID=1284658 RepID=UPI0023391E73|nr:LPS export ABC transporter periplasmic protein LptC [Planktomarina temperata]MDB2454567.1 LPS export ABC transporter periplasmic protein LptC [Planktomarina temperata]